MHECPSLSPGSSVVYSPRAIKGGGDSPDTSPPRAHILTMTRGDSKEPAHLVTYAVMGQGFRRGRAREHDAAGARRDVSGVRWPRFTWEEACRGVGDSTGGWGMGPCAAAGGCGASPLIKENGA